MINHLASSHKGLSLTLIIDNVFWGVYLLVLVVISFANHSPYSYQWLSIYSFIFMHAGLYCAFRYFIKKPLRLLFYTKVVIAILALILIWLILQCLLPVPSYLNEHLFTADRPKWFNHSTVLSVVPEKTQWVIVSQLVMMTLFVLTIALLSQRRRVKQLFYVFMFVGGAHALIAIVAKYSGLFLIDKTSLDGHFNAARGMFVNRNHLAAFIILCLTSPVAIQLRLLMKNQHKFMGDFLFKQIMTTSFFLFLLASIAIVLSESRGALLSMFVSFVIYFGFFKEPTKSPINKSVILIGTTVLIVLIVVILGQGIITRFSDNALSLGERTTQWDITWQAIKHQWLVGYGAGSYELVFQSFREFVDLRLVVYDQAHNDYLHILLEQGAIGLSLWLAFIFISVWVAARFYVTSNSTLEKSVLLGALITMSALLIQSVVDYQLQIMTIRCYFFVIIALVFSLPVMTRYQTIK